MKEKRGADVITVGNTTLMSRRAVAEKLGVTAMTLRTWGHRRHGPAGIVVGAKTYYSVAAIEKWLAKQFDKAERAG
jgi:DNA-binding transcriptional regulator YiaG